MESGKPIIFCPFCNGQTIFPDVHSLLNNVHYLINTGLVCPQCNIVSPNLETFHSHILSHTVTTTTTQRVKTEPPAENIPNNNNLDSMDEIDYLLKDVTEIVHQELKIDHSEVAKVEKVKSNFYPSMQPSSTVTRDSNIFHQTLQQQKLAFLPASEQQNLLATSSQQVQCNLCGWNFDDDNFLSIHKVLMHSRINDKSPSKEFQCRSCPSQPRSYDSYVQHLKEIHGDHRWVCAKCGKLFKLRGSLLVHMRVVHSPDGSGGNSSSFQCSVCGKKFSNKYRRNIHEKRHRESSSSNTIVNDRCKFPCNKCNMTFDEKREFEAHMTNHNVDHYQEDENDNHTCQICNEGFETQASLILHSVSHMKGRPFVSQQQQHNNDYKSLQQQKLWACEVCHKTFTTKYFLKKHNRLHTGETPYACHICGRAFTFQQSFHKHMLYHTDEKPYSCPQCGRAFKELSTLQNHERIHSGERPFACETCGKSFRQRVSYLVHRRIHTGAMPYMCNICGKSFRYKVTQRTHKCHNEEQQQQQSDQPNSVRSYPILPHELQMDLRKIRSSKVLGSNGPSNVMMSSNNRLSPVGKMERLMISEPQAMDGDQGEKTLLEQLFF